MEGVRRDVCVLLAALLLLALVAAPGLLALRRPPEDPPGARGARSALQPPPGSLDYLATDPVYPEEAPDGQFWRADAQAKLARELKRRPVDTPARNIIFFLGDGMGVSTLTAARVLKGQQDTSLRGGEQELLTFERFPHLALARTYCYDATVADSACSATSYLCGVKGNANTVGVTAEVQEGDCAGQKVAANRASSLLAWAQAAGRATGLVTTDSLTGASPAGVFAHSANRDWENDTVTPPECEDIASQLVTGPVGRGLRVVLGGGRDHFRGRRDGRDLAAEWLAGRGESEAVTVGTGQELAAVNASDIDYLLGLFAEDEMEYALGRAEGSEQPSLAEMTAKAIEVLEQHKEGFVLFVEGALVDKAHHKGMARRALAEVLELEAAVEAALERTDPRETLTIVTADHSHGFTISGYPDRGTDIFGSDPSNSPAYPSLMYATGPGPRPATWPPPPGTDLTDPAFSFPSAVYRDSAAHQGEEVAVYAVGPQAHLFRGLLQQHTIPHILAYAGCIGSGLTRCD